MSLRRTPLLRRAMKVDLSFLLLKKPLASKMKRGVRNACSSAASTTTVNQSTADADVSGGSPKTLEEMLLQLDIEEAAARRAKLDEYGELHRRMSCAARIDLSPCPRFSVDGLRSSYVNLEGGRNSVGCRPGGRMHEVDVERSLRLPPTVAGECVVWCRPSVVGRLMGLDAVPVPVRSGGRNGKRSSSSECRRRNLRRMGRYEELEKDRFAMGVSGCISRERYSATVMETISMGSTAEGDGSGSGGGPALYAQHVDQ